MEASGSQPGPGWGRWGLTWTVGGLCSHAPPEAPVWGLLPRPGWGASAAEEEARARPPGQWPSLFPSGGDRVETAPGFLTLLSTPHLSWSVAVGASRRLVLGQQVEGRRQREWPLTLLWEPVLQQRGLSNPSSRGTHTDSGSRTCLLCRVVLPSASPLVSLPRGGDVYG